MPIDGLHWLLEPSVVVKGRRDGDLVELRGVRLVNSTCDAGVEELALLYLA